MKAECLALTARRPSGAAAALIVGRQWGGCAPHCAAQAPERLAPHVGEGAQGGSSGSDIVPSRHSSGRMKLLNRGNKKAVRAIELRCAPDCSMFKRTQVC